METPDLIHQIRQLIAQNQTEDAIELLSGLQLDALDKELIILNSQYGRVKDELRMNLISRDEGERKINQINMALLELSNKIEARKSAPAVQGAPATPMAFNKKWLWLLLIPAALYLLYVIAFPSDSDDANDPNAPDTALNSEHSPTEPVKQMTVRFLLDTLHIIKDGDGAIDGYGEFFWTIRVNDQILDMRNQHDILEMGDGDMYEFNKSALFEVGDAEDGGISLEADIIEDDDTFSGADDTIHISHYYSFEDLNFASDNYIRGGMQGDKHGDPMVELHWRLQWVSDNE